MQESGGGIERSKPSSNGVSMRARTTLGSFRIASGILPEAPSSIYHKSQTAFQNFISSYLIVCIVFHDLKNIHQLHILQILSQSSLSPDALPKVAGSTKKYSTERSDAQIESKVCIYALLVCYNVLNMPDWCVRSGKYSTLSQVERCMNARSTIPSRHFRSIDLPSHNTSLHNFHSNAFVDCILHSCIYYYLNTIFKRPQ